MGYKRQQARKLAKQDKSIDPRMTERLRTQKAAREQKHDQGHFTVVYQEAQDGGACRVRIWNSSEGIAHLRTAFQHVYGRMARILSIKRGSSKRWVKPEHPIALRRRVREEERQKNFGMS